MTRVKQTSRRHTGGKAPRKSLASRSIRPSYDAARMAVSLNGSVEINSAAEKYGRAHSCSSSNMNFINNNNNNNINSNSADELIDEYDNNSSSNNNNNNSNSKNNNNNITDYIETEEDEEKYDRE